MHLYINPSIYYQKCLSISFSLRDTWFPNRPVNKVTPFLLLKSARLTDLVVFDWPNRRNDGPVMHYSSASYHILDWKLNVERVCGKFLLLLTSCHTSVSTFLCSWQKRKKLSACIFQIPDGINKYSWCTFSQNKSDISQILKKCNFDLQLSAFPLLCFGIKSNISGIWTKFNFDSQVFPLIGVQCFQPEIS